MLKPILFVELLRRFGFTSFQSNAQKSGAQPTMNLRVGDSSSSRRAKLPANLSRLIAADHGLLPEQSRVSLLRYSPALVLLIAVVMNVTQWADVDLWWHIYFGQATLAQGHAPVRDIYSYTAFGHPWLDHEWLTEVVLAALYNKLGVVGLKLFKFACSFAIAALLSTALAETGASSTIQLLILLVTAVGLAPFMQFRPQLFDFVFASALIAILTRDNYRRSGPLWLAIPIMLLWANLHGGFVAGLGILGTYTVAVIVQDFFTQRGLRHATNLCAITVAATLVTLINPYGVSLWKIVIGSTMLYTSHGALTEWWPTSTMLMIQFRSSPMTFVCLGFVLAMTGVLGIFLLMRPHGDDFPLLGVAAVATIAGFAAVRNLPLQAIALVPPLARRAKLLLGGVSAKRARTALTYELIVAALALAAALHAGEFSRTLVDGGPTPSGAVAFMRQHDLYGRVLCDLGWAGYLIWHTASRSKVFIDARLDMTYPRSLLNEYLIFSDGGSGAAKVLRRYPPDYVLIHQGSSAYRFMLQQTGWRLIYLDNVSGLFARVNLPAAHLKGIPFKGRTGQNLFPE